MASNGDPERDRGRHGGQHVVHVRTSDKRRAQRAPFHAACGRRSQPVERKRQRPWRDVGGTVDRVRHRPAPASVSEAPRGSSTLIRLGAWRGTISNSRASPGIRFHVAVEVEMIARQVREDARRRTAPRRRGAATARATTPPCAQAPHPRSPSRAAALQVGRLRRRVGRLDALAAIAVRPPCPCSPHGTPAASKIAATSTPWSSCRWCR